MSNAVTKQRLLTAIRTERIPHAVLITGPSGSGRSSLARLGAAVCCTGKEDCSALANEPNYIQLGPAPILIDDVRQMIDRLSKSAFRGSWRAVALLNADSMTVQAQNALLKTLEEPPEKTLFLLSGNENGLLPTIRSRCAILRLGAEPPDMVQNMLMQDGLSPEEAKRFSAMSGGIVGVAKAYQNEQYLAFRKQSLALLPLLIKGQLPFSQMKQLLDQPFGSAKEGTPGEQKRLAAVCCVNVWLAVFRDILFLQQGGDILYAPDWSQESAKLAARFTTGQIQGIIKALLEMHRRLMEKANPGLSMDTVLITLRKLLSLGENT